jgi:hypothetical protein
MAFVHARSEGPIDFDSVFASLSQHCPGTQLLDSDYGASRVAKLMEMSRSLGKTENNPVVSRALEATRKLGQTRQILVPLSDGGELVGTVSQGALLLASKDPIAAEVLAPVLAALEGFAQLHVKVSLEAVPQKFEPVWVKMPFQGEESEKTDRQKKEPVRVKKPWWKFWC